MAQALSPGSPGRRSDPERMAIAEWFPQFHRCRSKALRPTCLVPAHPRHTHDGRSNPASSPEPMPEVAKGEPGTSVRAPFNPIENTRTSFSSAVTSRNFPSRVTTMSSTLPNHTRQWDGFVLQCTAGSDEKCLQLEQAAAGGEQELAVGSHGQGRANLSLQARKDHVADGTDGQRAGVRVHGEHTDVPGTGIACLQELAVRRGQQVASGVRAGTRRLSPSQKWRTRERRQRACG